MLIRSQKISSSLLLQPGSEWRDKKRQGGGGGKVARISEQELLGKAWFGWPCGILAMLIRRQKISSSLLLQPGSDWSVCDSCESPALPGSCSAPDRGPLGLCKRT